MAASNSLSLPLASPKCKLLNHEAPILACHNRVQLLQAVTQDRPVGDTNNEYDLVIACDPGTVNAGASFFSRNLDGKLQLLLAIQYDIQKGAVHPTELPAFFWHGWRNLVEAFTKCCARFEGDIPISRVAVVVESQLPQNRDMHNFAYAMEALLISIRPFLSFYVKFVTISPNTIKAWTKPPAGCGYDQRKEHVKQLVEEMVGTTLPRHDVSDSIAIGCIAVNSGKLVLRPLRLTSAMTEPLFREQEPPPQQANLDSNAQSKEIEGLKTLQDVNQQTPSTQEKDNNETTQRYDQQGNADVGEDGEETRQPVGEHGGQTNGDARNRLTNSQWCAKPTLLGDSCSDGDY